MAEHNHPQRLTESYGRQFSRPEDAQRQAELDARREELEAIIDEGPKPHPGMSELAESLDAVLDHAGAVNVTERVAGAVDQAISQAVAQAGKKVVAASWSQEEKTAKAFCDELEARNMILSGNGLYVAEDDDEPATDAETQALVAELDDDSLFHEDDDSIEYERAE
jgi:hypothetical protein